MRFCAVVASGLLCVSSARAAVHLEQQANTADRFFERLPDLRLVRGSGVKTIALNVSAEAGEAWQITKDRDWLFVVPSAGIGPAVVLVRFDGAALALLTAPTASVTITSEDDPQTNHDSLDVRFDIWPNLSDAQTPAQLRAYAKDPLNWPKDGFGSSWELWGFLPDESTHGAGAGANLLASEKTACAGVDDDSCTRVGQAGLAAGSSSDQAWLLSTGDPRVVVAVLDSGIRWGDTNLTNQFYLNAHELVSCAPPGADLATSDPLLAFDVNDDGVFSIRDYDDASWLADVNGNGLRDPEDLIWGDNGDGPCSDGVDDDNNGYTDDIAGWDFFWNDNDASDDTDYGHGTGEARDSTGEAHDGDGTPGGCPRCRVLPVRAGDSFVVDVNQFADGVLFAVESGASVVQEALGALNNTPYAQAAINWAYQNNVPIIASAADETSYHHNYPGSLEHTFYVHAIVADTDGDFAQASTFLNFGNCTNFGGKLMLSTPGTGCSSEATGKTSGQAGLLVSYFKQLQDAAVGTANEAYYSSPLTAEEVYQTLATTADDIDVPGAERDPEALALKKYPSNAGWDLHFGYGRNNVRRSLEALRDQRIPVGADISQPRWFQVFDPARTASVEVTGTVDSARLTNVSWELYVAEGVVGTDFVKVASGAGAVQNGLLGSVSLSASGPLGSLVRRAGGQAGKDPHEFSATLELRTIGRNGVGDDVRGVFRKTFGVRHDADTLPGFPLFLASSGESSPKLTDVDGDGGEEIVLATSDGLVHALTAAAHELPGFPATLGAYPPLSQALCGADDHFTAQCFRGARPFATGAIDPDTIRQSVISSVAVGDLDGAGTGCRDIVVGSLDGFVYAMNCRGEMRDGFPVEIDRTTLSDGEARARRCLKDGVEVVGCNSGQQFGESGFFSSPALTDLDGDGALEIVIGGLDSWAYAWHGTDGSVVNGWPVHLDNPDIPAFDAQGDPRRFVDRIISSPTIADIFGDGTPIAFFGSNERVAQQSASYLYGVWPDGNAHVGGPFPPGWPTELVGFIADEILPYVGRGNPNSAAAADVDGDGDDEIIAAGLGGGMVVFERDGRNARNMAFTSEYYGPYENIDAVANAFSLPVINNPSVADIDGDGVLEIINGTAGSGLIQLASAGGQRAEFDHSVSAWNVEEFYYLDGFPHRVWDYQFFMNYAVADLDNAGKWNVISGDGGYFVYAPDPSGKEAPGFPKWTQGWHISTPAIGDLDGDQAIDVVSSTREGDLWVWKTPGHVRGPKAQQPAILWEGFHHDDHNTGNAGGALKPYAPLPAPDDACAGGCCCNAAVVSSSTSSTQSGFAAAALLFAVVVRARKRQRVYMGDER